MKKYIIIFVALLCALSLKAQTTIPYSNSFEDDTENSNWVLGGKSGSKCKDKWYIDTVPSLMTLDGKAALYISSDDGVNPFFAKTKNISIAYRPISLPATATTITPLAISFDWKANGYGDKSGLYVAVVPANIPIDSDPKQVKHPWWLTTTKLSFTLQDGTTDVDKLTGTEVWENTYAEMQLNPNEDYNLVFVWISEYLKDDSLSYPLAACIDNIQLTYLDCTTPTNLKVDFDCDSTYVSWDGVIFDYVLEYRRSGTQRWSRMHTPINKNTYAIAGLAEGAYDFRVRSKCGEGSYSAYSTIYSSLVYCAEDMCINYLDLNDSKIACLIGEAGDPLLGYSPPVDHGSSHMKSRHTVHTNRNEKDPRTFNQLKTVPDGAIASVRLGNWDNGAEAEGMEIEYTVDTNDVSILMLQYAVVFEDPDHDTIDQPYFKLVLLDKYDDMIDETCGLAEFYADSEAEGWRTHKHNGATIVWKDWTSIGFNLKPYHGTTIKLQLRTQDCTLDAHYGYAYFTLGCAQGTLEGVSCGDVASLDLKAPDGFDYRWYYIDDNGKEIEQGSEQIYPAQASDTRSYYCDVMFQENHDCKFTIDTKVRPRLPKAIPIVNRVPKDCRNLVELVSDSRVINLTADNDTIITDEPTETSYWDFGDGNLIFGNKYLHEVDPNGESFDVKLITGIANDGCMDSITFRVDIPSIYSDTAVVDSTICWGESVLFENKIFGQDTTAVFNLLNYAGCDSILILNLDVMDRLAPTERFDSICHGDTIMHDGGFYTEEGEYKFMYPTAEGCDSIFIINLHVNPEITFTIETIPEQGAVNTGEIRIKDAPANYTYKLNSVLNAPLTGLGGGSYEIIVIDGDCESAPHTTTIESDCIVVDLDSVPVACADEQNIQIPISIIEGNASTYSIEYSNNATTERFVNVVDTPMTDHIIITLPDSCKPNIYSANIIIHDVICADTIIPIKFTVLYSSSIMTQKWNDVIALLSKDYNGGYTFSDYQWYRNGEPLVEDKDNKEDGPYLYLNGDNFNLNDEYSVLLTRAEDSVSLMTCIMVPTMKNDIHDYPTRTLADKSQKIELHNISGEGTATWYDVQGRMCGQYRFSNNSNEITTPNIAGFYVLEVVTSDNRKVYKIYIK